MFNDALQFLAGRLTPSAFVHDPIMEGAGVAMVGALILAVVALTYFKKWKWLWKNWITSLDPKKIGVMYLLVSAVMLLRGLADALLLRTQQATDNAAGTILTSDHFQQIFSAHGSIMIFFVAMGVIFGVFNLIIHNPDRADDDD